MQREELKQIRTSLRLSQAEFAARLGLSRVFVGMMERGDKPIGERTVMAARAILKNERLVDDSFSVLPAKDGSYLVARRTERERFDTEAMYHGQSSLIAYGKFNRRDHAYRWASALHVSPDPRAARGFARMREAAIENMGNSQ